MTSASLGILVSALLGLVPLMGARYLREKAASARERETAQSYLLVQTRLLVCVAASVITPAIFQQVIDHLPSDYDRELAGAIIIGLAWLPAIALGSLSLLVLICGPQVLHHLGTTQQIRSQSHQGMKRQIQVAVASAFLVVLTIAIILLGPWNIDDVNAFALDHQLFNLIVQAVLSVLVLYPFWVYWCWTKPCDADNQEKMEDRNA